MMMWKQMVILWSLLVLLAIGAAEDQSQTIAYETDIDQGVLKSVKQLQKTDELDLSSRGITDIDDDVFRNVSVKILNLESNKISRLAAGAFSGLGEDLEELNLASNRINLINSSFVGLKNLKLLNFSNNPVEYLAAGEFAGIPKTADVIVTGNTLHTLSTRVFEEPTPDPPDEEDEEDEDEEDEDEESIERALSVARDEPISWTEPSTPLIEKSQLLMFADSIIDLDYKPRLGLAPRTIFCTEDSVLKRVRVLEEGESLPKDCFDTVTDGGSGFLELQGLEIGGVAKGWYQLEDIPVVYISLSNNKLTELSPELLNDLPEGVSIVDLSSNLIKKIKKGTFSNYHLKGINLKTNLIEDVEDGSFESSNLLALYLAENKISDISFSASLPTSLNLLYFNKNRILRIPDGVFSRLENLTQLDLDENRITKIQSKAFEGLTSLNTLDLAGNQISKIEAGAFLGLENLVAISFSGNLLSSCDGGAFDGLENLTSLSLSLNKFTNITKNSFGELPATLLYLDLEGNEIAEIESDVFVDVPKNTLKLNSNKISKILPNHFKINDLKELHLGNNSITEISKDSFASLSAVTHLSLAMNQISHIPRDTLKNLTVLTRFDIARNPITKLKNGALNGLSKPKNGAIFIDGNRLEVIQGGVFEDV